MDNDTMARFKALGRTAFHTDLKISKTIFEQILRLGRLLRAQPSPQVN